MTASSLFWLDATSLAHLYFFVAFYTRPQSEAGTKIALYELYSTVSKQENAHLEAVLLVAGAFNAGKLKSVVPNFNQHVKCATREKITL